MISSPQIYIRRADEMKNYIPDIFFDTILSIITKKYGTTLNDDEREDKAYDLIDELKENNKFTVDMTQALIDKKGFNDCYVTNAGGTSVYALVKEGMFKKVKVCFLITRNKDRIDGEYLDQIYEELRRQANGENVFNSRDYKNG
jgi:hypothetical protein